MARVKDAFQEMVAAVATDYAVTHLKSDEPLQTNAVALIKQWRDGAKSKDALHLWLRGVKDYPELLDAAVRFVRTLRNVANESRDVLEPKLVVAIDKTWNLLIPEATVFKDMYPLAEVAKGRGNLVVMVNEKAVDITSDIANVLSESKPAWLTMANTDLEAAYGLRDYYREQRAPAD